MYPDTEPQNAELETPDTAASGPGRAVSCNPTLPSQGLVWRGIFVMPHEPAGCVFHPRCPYVTPRCMSESPVRRKIGSRIVAYHAIEEGRI